MKRSQGLHNPAVWALVLAAGAVAAMLALIFHPRLLNTDTAQYVVTARHLLRGEGLVTSLIYFEEQMAAGTIPAPQTVWPPGYPLLVALLLAMGIPALYAPFLLALASHIASTFVLYVVLRRIGCGPWLSAGGGVAFCTASFSAILTLRGLSEGTYTLCTLLVALVLTSASPHHRRVLFAAGMLAALAFAVRYSGITIMAALGVVVGSRFLAERTWKAWWDAVIVMVPCVVAIGGLFWRNYLLTSTITGGPSMERDSNLVEVLRRILWSLEQIAGIFDSTNGVLSIALAAALAGLVLAWLWRFRSSVQAVWQVTPVADVLILAGSYAVFTIILYGALGYVRIPDMITARYLLPLLPFVVIGVCVAAAGVPRIGHTVSTQSKLTGLIAGTALAAFLLIQIHAAGLWRNWLQDDRKFITMIQAIGQPTVPGTLGEFIRRHRGDGTILAVDGQLLGMWLDVPSVGLTDHYWTGRTWTTAEVHALVRRFNVTIVCVFPEIFDESASASSHWQFFVDLEEGRIPPWLELAASTSAVQIYLVRPEV